MANLRLPRFVGDRLARQAIMYGRRINCNSPEGRLICDEVVPADQMDDALIQVVDNLTNSGIVSAVGNRRQFRIGQEPLDLFRQYLALFAKEQALCHFSSGPCPSDPQHDLRYCWYVSTSYPLLAFLLANSVGLGAPS